MIGKLIEFSVQNKVLMLLLTAVLIIGGVYSMYTIRLDAIPDLSDVQVIVLTKYPGQAPQVVEDQVTYPLTTTMLAVPHAKVVRGYSMFGYSFIYVIFETVHGEFMKFLTMEDETDIFEVTLFPKVYLKFGHVLQRDHGPYLVTGKVEDDGGDITVTARGIERLG